MGKLESSADVVHCVANGTKEMSCAVKISHRRKNTDGILKIDCSKFLLMT
jgi:hypothetical protein